MCTVDCLKIFKWKLPFMSTNLHSINHNKVKTCFRNVYKFINNQKMKCWIYSCIHTLNSVRVDCQRHVSKPVQPFLTCMLWAIDRWTVTPVAGLIRSGSGFLWRLLFLGTQILPSTLTSVLACVAEMHTCSMMQPPPCITIGMVHSAWSCAQRVQGGYYILEM